MPPKMESSSSVQSERWRESASLERIAGEPTGAASLDSCFRAGEKLGDLDSHGASFDKPGDEDFS
jgi:Ser/Thr protein kinase RdoA (MazF antagonist)